MGHPVLEEHYQCVTTDSFSQKWAELTYNAASVCGFYLIPVIVIVVCFRSILKNIDSFSPQHHPRNRKASGSVESTISETLKAQDANGKTSRGHVKSRKIASEKPCCAAAADGSSDVALSLAPAPAAGAAAGTAAGEQRIVCNGGKHAGSHFHVSFIHSLNHPLLLSLNHPLLLSQISQSLSSNRQAPSH